MRWGVFECPHEIHTAPVDRLSRMLPPHIPSLECECRPTVRWEGGFTKTLVNHHDGH